MATAVAQTGSPPLGDRWLTHFTEDLLPFWTVPAALGSPPGNFPSTRCDDGALLDYRNPCPPIAGNLYLLTPAQYLVTLSRQVYGYGVAYHLTGDAQYLHYMKAGVTYIRQNWVDRAGGGMFTTRDLAKNNWGPRREFRNAQELGYGLLGLSFYYYLTRDDDVLPDILAIKNYIIGTYYNPSLGAMQWTLENNGTERFDRKQLVSDLDQMNTYLVLLAPILPEPQQSEWKQTLQLLSHSIMGVYYSPSDNLLFTSANSPADTDSSTSGVDFGHTSKGLWMMRWTGLMTGDRGMTQWAESAGLRHLQRSYLPEDGSWATGIVPGGIVPGGQVDKNKNWWVYAELDQFSGTLALADPSAGRYLSTTADYWFKYFVDPQHGEVWNGVNYPSNTPQRNFPKQWQWKSAYHSFEHALVGYIAGQFLHGQSVTLHYAFQKPVEDALIHPYYLPGTLQRLVETVVETVDKTEDAGGSRFQTATFTRVPGATAPTALRIVNAASSLATPVAAGAMASAFGSHLATATQPAASGQVAIDDAKGAHWVATPFYVSPGQVNFVLPASAASGTASITVTAADGMKTAGTVEVASVSPGMFQLKAGTALAAANVVRVRADGSQANEPVYRVGAGGEVQAEPIDLESSAEQVYLTLWGSGLARAHTVSVTVGGLAAVVLYSGPSGTDGLDQLNVGPLPVALKGRGRANIIVAADGQTANPVQVSIR